MLNGLFLFLDISTSDYADFYAIISGMKKTLPGGFSVRPAVHMCVSYFHVWEAGGIQIRNLNVPAAAVIIRVSRIALSHGALPVKPPHHKTVNDVGVMFGGRDKGCGCDDRVVQFVVRPDCVSNTCGAVCIGS